MVTLGGRWIRVVFLAVMVAGSPAFAGEDSPEASIDALHEILVQIMRDDGGFADRVKALEPVLDRIYNFSLMTRVAVGRTWTDLDDPVRDRAIAAFRRNAIATYASRFVDYDGETFEILGTRSTDTGDVVVATRIAPKDHEPVALDYLMRRGDAGWRVADVYLAGTISELATKRSEFTALIGQGGIEGLIAALNEKADVLATE